MAFKIAQDAHTFGETTIENIFITDYMPQAPSDYVKVYMLGFYCASIQATQVSNEQLAKRLAMPIERVVAAWHYWQKQQLVQIHKTDVLHSDHQFNIVFQSIRQLHLHATTREPVPDVVKPTPSDRLMAAMTNPVIKKMFADIEFIIRRRLSAQDMQRVLDFIFNYKMDVDMVVSAFEIAYEQRESSKQRLSYVEGIIKNWFDQHIFTREQLVAQNEEEQRRYQLVRKVCRLLGFNMQNIPAELTKAVEQWQHGYHFNDDVVLYVVQEATKRTNNPNINYLTSLFKAIAESGDMHLEQVKQFFERRSIKGKQGTVDKKRRTNFQNFSQDTIANLSQDDLTAIIKRKSKRVNR